MFNVHYRLSTGEIISYQEGAKPNPEDIKDTDIGILSFPYSIPGFVDQNGRLMMKIDVEANKLAWLNPQQLPDPLPNPENAARQ